MEIHGYHQTVVHFEYEFELPLQDINWISARQLADDGRWGMVMSVSVSNTLIVRKISARLWNKCPWKTMWIFNGSQRMFDPWPFLSHHQNNIYKICVYKFPLVDTKLRFRKMYKLFLKPVCMFSHEFFRFPIFLLYIKRHSIFLHTFFFFIMLCGILCSYLRQDSGQRDGNEMRQRSLARLEQEYCGSGSAPQTSRSPEHPVLCLL